LKETNFYLILVEYKIKIMNLKGIFAIQMLMMLGLFSTSSSENLKEENKISLMHLIQSILLDPEYLALSDTEKLVVLDAVIILLREVYKTNSGNKR
jgi:hypothetical protein